MGSLRSLSFVILAGCSRTVAPPPPQPVESATWLCRPDRTDDPCLRADLTVTELRADGTRSIAPRVAAKDPPADCFYVYPTVDLDLVPRNHEDLTDTRRMLAVTLAQAGGFRETCALWVPLYRQITIGMYLQPKDEREKGLARAFEDVDRAFREYLASVDSKRKVVIVGHSQGGEMVIRLLRKYFDHDERMRERLVLGMPIGAEVEAPAGATKGATFANLPACTRPLETKCIVAYRTHETGKAVDPDRWAPRAGNDTICVDPASLDAPGTLLSRAVFPVVDVWGGRARVAGLEDVTTPYAAQHDHYAAGCTRGERGYAYLGVDFHDRRFERGKLGLHVLDMQLTQGDLVALVRRRLYSVAK